LNDECLMRSASGVAHPFGNTQSKTSNPSISDSAHKSPEELNIGRHRCPTTQQLPLGTAHSVFPNDDEQENQIPVG
jgi:hypothetical protein